MIKIYIKNKFTIKKGSLKWKRLNQNFKKISLKKEKIPILSFPKLKIESHILIKTKNKYFDKLSKSL
jgi:arsenate reductase-like glutaredoxin family protein